MMPAVAPARPRRGSRAVSSAVPLFAAAAPPAAAQTSRPAPLFTGLPPVRLAAFEGPLDLLLHLVRVGQMDIFDLPIATLCGQYLDYLSAMEEWDLQIAGEFLVMAATLVEIKSRLLLPPLPKAVGEADENGGLSGSEGGTDDPRAELVQRLLEYGRYQGIADTLKGAEGERQRLFFRPATDFRPEFALPPRFGEMSADALLKTLERLLDTAGEAGERAVTSVRRQKLTLRMTMREVMGRAERAGPTGVDLNDLLPSSPVALLEVVLLFLSLLELLRGGSVIVAQETFCGEIRIWFLPEAERVSGVGAQDTEAFPDDGK